jgi:hypothetical protein
LEVLERGLKIQKRLRTNLINHIKFKPQNTNRFLAPEDRCWKVPDNGFAKVLPRYKSKKLKTVSFDDKKKIPIKLPPSIPKYLIVPHEKHLSRIFC